METQPIVLTRLFRATPETVWKALMEPEKLKQWWGPAHFTAPVIKTDPKVGGKYLYAMKAEDGKIFWSTGIYKEITPNRIVMTDSFADEKGNVVSSEAYGMTGIPEELLITFTLDKQGDQTKFTLKHEGFPPGEMRDMCIEGWTETLEKLERVVQSNSKTYEAHP